MKIAIVVVVIFIAVSVGGVLLSKSSWTSPSQAETSGTSVLAVESDNRNNQNMNEMMQDTVAAISPADISSHDSVVSCWAAIDGKVYDLTNWINKHPGGPARILSICGTDATNAFSAQHGGQARAEAELTQFYIGDLSN